MSVPGKVMSKESYLSLLDILYKYSLNGSTETTEDINIGKSKDSVLCISSESPGLHKRFQFKSIVTIKLEFYSTGVDGNQLLESQYEEDAFLYRDNLEDCAIELIKGINLPIKGSPEDLSVNLEVTWDHKNPINIQLNKWYSHRGGSLFPEEFLFKAKSEIRLNQRGWGFELIAQNPIITTRCNIWLKGNIIHRTYSTVSYIIGNILDPVIMSSISCLICEGRVYSSVTSLIDHFKHSHGLLRLAIWSSKGTNIKLQVTPVIGYVREPHTFEGTQEAFHSVNTELPNVDLKLSESDQSYLRGEIKVKEEDEES